LPYEQYLKRFPAYLSAANHGKQRKHVTLGGKTVNYQTGPVYWGDPHQRSALILSTDSSGHTAIPCDFIAFGHPLTPLGRHHDILRREVFAQAEALAFCKTRRKSKRGTPDALVPHRVLKATVRQMSFLPTDSRRPRPRQTRPRFRNTASTRKRDLEQLIRLTSGVSN